MDFGIEEAKQSVLAWLKLYQNTSDDNFVMNQEKADKMNVIIAFCQYMESNYDNCFIARCELTPKHQQGFIELLIDEELVIEDTAIVKFKEAVSLCDAINIEAFGENFVHFTFFIDELYKLSK